MNDMNAFQYLNDLDRKFTRNIGDVVCEQQSSMRTLHFRVGRYDLLLPLDTSTEVLSNLKFTPVPISRSWILGIASLRGQLVTIIDLKNFLFKADSLKKMSGHRIVVSKVGEVFLGFVVDQVVGLMNLKKEDFVDSYPEHWDSNLVDYLSGIYREGSGYFGVCDLLKMLNDTRFIEGQQSVT